MDAQLKLGGLVVNFVPIGETCHACRLKNTRNYLDAIQILAFGLAAILQVELVVTVVSTQYRSTLHKVYSLPRRAAMTRHTDCHAGQQQQPGLAQTAPRFCQHPIRWAFTSQAFTRWRHLSTPSTRAALFSSSNTREFKKCANLCTFVSLQLSR